MKKQMTLKILIFGMFMLGAAAMLTSTSLHAAKVCVQESVYQDFTYPNKNWYCHTANSGTLSVAYTTTNHGIGNYCWCIVGGIWKYIVTIEGSCTLTNNCPWICIREFWW
jgi:hypothetical protein